MAQRELIEDIGVQPGQVSDDEIGFDQPLHDLSADLAGLTQFIRAIRDRNARLRRSWFDHVVEDLATSSPRLRSTAKVRRRLMSPGGS